MKLIIGNLKMNLNHQEIKEYINYFKDKNYQNVFFAPSHIYLNDFVNNGLKIIAQDVSMFQNGAYTGDISSSQLKSMKVDYSLVGHYERRKYYNDSLYVNEKIKNLLNEEINPILCVGESLEQRQEKKVFDVLKEEIDDAFKDIDIHKLSKVIIAYEPVWSIGTGLVPKNNEISEVVTYIKKYVFDKYQNDIKVLYGGSVNNNCINDLESIDNLDGYLVGGCSLKYEDFDKLINHIS